jgi:hypothetical protein
MKVEQDPEARAHYLRQVVFAYKRVFASNEGKMVLEDIRQAFAMDMGAFLSTATRPGQPIVMDPYYAAKRDGQRDVFLHINHQINREIEPDGNLEGPELTVLTGLREDPL